MPSLGEDDAESLAKQISKSFLTHGPTAEALASSCALRLGKKWGIALQSGTDAIATALIILKKGKSAKFAVPSYICSSPLDAASVAGLSPLPIDIDRETLAISPDLVNERNDIKIVLGAHLFGIPANLNRIENADLIEDCAQTLAVKNSDGQLVGASGKISVCSFYATKLLASGHGGLIAGNDESLKAKAMDLLVHDKRDRWRPRLHYLMSDLAAALGKSQIAKLDDFISARRRIARRFSAALGEMPHPRSVFSRFIVVSAKKNGADDLIRKFELKGIEAKHPVFLPLYKLLRMPDRSFPNAAWAHMNIVSVPIYPSMKEDFILRTEEFLSENKNEMRCWPPA